MGRPSKIKRATGIALRTLHMFGVSPKKLAEIFNVSVRTIYRHLK